MSSSEDAHDSAPKEPEQDDASLSGPEADGQANQSVESDAHGGHDEVVYHQEDEGQEGDGLQSPAAADELHDENEAMETDEHIEGVGSPCIRGIDDIDNCERRTEGSPPSSRVRSPSTPVLQGTMPGTTGQGVSPLEDRSALHDEMSSPLSPTTGITASEETAAPSTPLPNATLQTITPPATAKPKCSQSMAQKLQSLVPLAIRTQQNTYLDKIRGLLTCTCGPGAPIMDAGSIPTVESALKFVDHHLSAHMQCKCTVHVTLAAAAFFMTLRGPVTKQTSILWAQLCRTEGNNDGLKRLLRDNGTTEMFIFNPGSVESGDGTHEEAERVETQESVQALPDKWQNFKTQHSIRIEAEYYFVDAFPEFRGIANLARTFEMEVCLHAFHVADARLGVKLSLVQQLVAMHPNVWRTAMVMQESFQPHLTWHPQPLFVFDEEDDGKTVVIQVPKQAGDGSRFTANFVFCATGSVTIIIPSNAPLDDDLEGEMRYMAFMECANSRGIHTKELQIPAGKVLALDAKIPWTAFRGSKSSIGHITYSAASSPSIIPFEVQNDKVSSFEMELLPDYVQETKSNAIVSF
ncbi:hypothetical protein BC567DRAFT_267950 [Phyllosticta citribraziliensis]